MSLADVAHAGDPAVVRPKTATSDLVRVLGQLDSTMIVVGILSARASLSSRPNQPGWWERPVGCSLSGLSRA
jgi:hypothetical protein